MNAGCGQVTRRTMTNSELDEQCRLWHHADRQVRHCPNPRCPGRQELPMDLVDVEEAPDVTDELEHVSEEGH